MVDSFGGTLSQALSGVHPLAMEAGAGSHLERAGTVEDPMILLPCLAAIRPPSRIGPSGPVVWYDRALNG